MILVDRVLDRIDSMKEKRELQREQEFLAELHADPDPRDVEIWEREAEEADTLEAETSHALWAVEQLDAQIKTLQNGDR